MKTNMMRFSPWTLATRVLRTPMRRGGSILAIASLAIALDAKADGGAWQWSLTPYFWATNVGAKVTVDDSTVLDRTASFTDLVKDVDMTVQARVEAQHGSHGAMVDVFNTELSKESSVPLPGVSGAEADVSAKLSMTILDAGGLYAPRGDRDGFGLYYGARGLLQRATVDTEIQAGRVPAGQKHRDVNETLVDGLVGARYVGRLSRKWSCLVRADASVGDTSDTWSAGAGFACAFGKRDRYALTAGYRYMEIDFRGEHALDARVTLSGFASGLRISF